MTFKSSRTRDYLCIRKVGRRPSHHEQYGAADKSPGKDIRLGIVGAVPEMQLAKQWLIHLNLMSAAHEKNGKRSRDWPGGQRALGVTFNVDDRFVRIVDQSRLDLALHDPGQVQRFEALLDLFDDRIQSLLGDVRPDCILVCLSDELADLRISNLRLSEVERAALAMASLAVSLSQTQRS